MSAGKRNFFLGFLILLLACAILVSCETNSSNGDDDISPDDDSSVDNDSDDDDVVDDDSMSDDDCLSDDDSNADDDSSADDDTSENYFPLKDESGRTMILRGANFMAIEAGGQPIDYERMTEWGFNIVRILITWEALEPQQGVYDDNYLSDIVEPQVGYANDEGILVILDMHQYHWSSCCEGMGIPSWTCADLPDGTFEWLWQSGKFWNHPEYLDAFIAAWEHVAEHFAGDDRIFAYDLFNEPVAGLRTLPWTFENPLLRPLYLRLIEAVRIIHPEPYLIIEPSIVHGAGFPFVMKPIFEERLIYSPHLYPGTIAIGGGYKFPKELIQYQLNHWVKEAAKQKLPMLIGETGIVSAAYHAEEYARDSTDYMEDVMAHWTWWAFGYDDDSMGLCDASGQPKEIFLRYLSRPYPRITAGQLRSFQFDSDSRIFNVTFDNENGLSPAVEIFINKDFHYPEGFEVLSSDEEGAWSHSFDGSTGILTVTCSPYVKTHTVTVKPAGNKVIC